MKKLGIYIVVLFSFVSLAYSQEIQPLPDNELVFHSAFEKELFGAPESTFIMKILATEPSADHLMANDFESAYNKNLALFKKRLGKTKNEQQFVRYLFYKLHRKSLKRYEQYVSFADMVTRGSYDCLTASSLYAVYLLDLGFKLDIVETEFHMYLRVYTRNGPVLLETTDPLYGFISLADEVAAFDKEYAGSKNEDLLQG